MKNAKTVFISLIGVIVLSTIIISGCATMPVNINQNKNGRMAFKVNNGTMPTIAAKLINGDTVLFRHSYLRGGLFSKPPYHHYRIIKYDNNRKEIAKYNFKKLGIPFQYIGWERGSQVQTRLHILWRSIAVDSKDNIWAVGWATVFIPHAYGKQPTETYLGVIEELSSLGKYIKSFYIPHKKLECIFIKPNNKKIITFKYTAP